MKCFVDLDGVLVDFIGGVCKLHNKPNPFEDERNYGQYEIIEIWDMPKEEFWQPINADFWFNLKPLPHYQRLLAVCLDLFGEDNVCLLTSPSLNEGATDGKIRWIYKHLPQFKRHFFVGAAKEFCAHENAVLIDDYDININRFRSHEGHGVLFPQPWNSKYKACLIQYGHDYVMDCVVGELLKIWSNQNAEY